MINDITFVVLKLVVSVCAILVTIYVIPFLKSKVDDKQWNDLLDIVEKSVLAAEQTIGAKNGTIKKSEVMAFVMDYISDKGLNLTKELVDQLVEAAVYKMNNGGISQW